jgi:nucleotide-binding universal stress UspA family protein
MGEILEIKLILCPVDFSEISIRAYRYALSLAEHYQARLVVQHIVELWRHPSVGFVTSADLYEEFERTLRESGKEQLREFVKKHTYGEIQPELVMHGGFASDSILAFAQAQNTDVIVIGSHGRRGFDRLMLGSVTDRVMRRASCPVLVVGKLFTESLPADERRPHLHHVSRILFCTDFSENSEWALNYAISVRAEYDAELTLLHVLHEPSTPAETEEAIVAAKQRLDRLIASQGRKSLKIETAVRIGKPYEQIIQFSVNAQIDMVTMGVRGRSALDVAVFGSTTYRVMQLGPSPVLAVAQKF